MPTKSSQLESYRALVKPRGQEQEPPPASAAFLKRICTHPCKRQKRLLPPSA